VVTTDPSQKAAEYHDRMPLVLTPDLYDGWLDPRADAEQVAYELDALGGSANVRFQLDRDPVWFERARVAIRARLEQLTVH
jgi:hypothetical protein